MSDQKTTQYGSFLPELLENRQLLSVSPLHAMDLHRDDHHPTQPAVVMSLQTRTVAQPKVPAANTFSSEPIRIGNVARTGTDAVGAGARHVTTHVAAKKPVKPVKPAKPAKPAKPLHAKPHAAKPVHATPKPPHVTETKPAVTVQTLTPTAPVSQQPTGGPEVAVTPTQNTPTPVDPTQSAPAQNNPAAVEPTQNAPAPSDPTPTDPTQGDPAPSDPSTTPLILNEPDAPNGTTWADESANPLFGPNGPSPDDVYQGSAADCYFLATISSVARTDPALIEQDVTQIAAGEYQVTFYNNGQPVEEDVDGYLPVDGNNNLVYAQFGQGNDIWVPIMEKAFAIFRSAVQGNPASYANIDYGWAEEVYNDLNASGVTYQETDTLVDGPTLANAVEQGLSNGQAMAFMTNVVPNAGPLIGNHVYSVVGINQNDDGSYTLELRNPYGNDGPNSDGYNFIDAGVAQVQLADLASAYV